LGKLAVIKRMWAATRRRADANGMLSIAVSAGNVGLTELSLTL
jgi:hypothetical protein